MSKYNVKNLIAQSKAYKTKTEQKAFLETELKEIISDFETIKNTVPKGILELTLNGKHSKINVNPQNETYYNIHINSYNSFIEDVEKHLYSINILVEIEKDINEILSIKDKTTKLKKLYSLLQFYKSNKIDVDFLLKDKPETADKMRKENKFAIKLIKKNISEIENQPTNKVENNTLAPTDLIMSIQFIESILNDINTLLFENSTLQQWDEIFNNTIPPTPIVLKSNVELKDIRYFFDELAKEKYLTRNYLTPFEKLNAFLFKDTTLTAQRLKDGRQRNNAPPPKLKNEIDYIFDK